MTSLMEHATKSRIRISSREAIYIFDGPLTGEEDWNHRIRVRHSHDKDKRQYTTTVSRCVARTQGGFDVERHAVFSDLYMTFASQPVARYSDKSFMAYCTSINDAIDAAVNDNVESAVRDALRLARDYVGAVVS